MKVWLKHIFRSMDAGERMSYIPPSAMIEEVRPLQVLIKND